VTAPLARLRALPPARRRAVLKALGQEDARALLHAWRFWARPEQLAPGTPGAADPRSDWTFWLLLAGRGFGKSRTGSEWAIDQARAMPGSHGALVAPTAADARDTMVSYGHESTEGASGILAVSPPSFRPAFEPSKRLLTWPNGTTATLYSAEEPDRLRGPQHHWAACDELAAWGRAQETWDMLMFGLRLGDNPRCCITTTPRPIPVVRQILADPRTVTTKGTTYDNRDNLARPFFESIISRYEGTRLGRQELEAELLEDTPGALWTLGMIEAARVAAAPALTRIVVAVDPAVSNTDRSDETGIIAAGVGPCNCRGPTEQHGFILEDRSGKYSPNGWAAEAVALYHKLGADRIVAEVNQGGDLVETNVRTVDPRVAYRAVHASRGKRTRAEPVSALSEQGRIHFVGAFPALEDQLTTWDASTNARSPDRLDAAVWAITDLMLGRKTPSVSGMVIPDLGQANPWSS